MIVVEADDDLAACVMGFFAGRFDVKRAADLRTASVGVVGQPVDVLFADIDATSPVDLKAITTIRQNHPGLGIIVTHLAPMRTEDSYTRLAASADVVVRKPYNLTEVDAAMRSINEKPITGNDTEEVQP